MHTFFSTVCVGLLNSLQYKGLITKHTELSEYDKNSLMPTNFFRKVVGVSLKCEFRISLIFPSIENIRFRLTTRLYKKCLSCIYISKIIFLNLIIFSSFITLKIVKTYVKQRVLSQIWSHALFLCINSFKSYLMESVNFVHEILNLPGKFI